MMVYYSGLKFCNDNKRNTLMNRAIFCGIFSMILWAAAAGAAPVIIAPEKSAETHVKNHGISIKDGVITSANTTPGVYTSVFLNRIGQLYQPDMQLQFEYRTEIPSGGRIRYVGVAFHFPKAGMTFNSFPATDKWQSASLDMKKLKFHSKIPAEKGEAIRRLHLYIRMPNDAPAQARLQVRNIRFVPMTPVSVFSADRAFVPPRKPLTGGVKDGVFFVENSKPQTSIPLSFKLDSMAYDPAYKLCLDYRSKVLSGGKERYIGVNFRHKTGGTTFSMLKASPAWQSASIPMGNLKFHKAGKLRKGEMLDAVVIYSRFENDAPGTVRLEVRNVRFEPDPEYDPRSLTRLSYSALPLISWRPDPAAESYIVSCFQDGREVFKASSLTPYFVPSAPLKPGIYTFIAKSVPSGKLVVTEDVRVPERFHTWQLPAYDFTSFAAQPRPILKKLAQYWNPEPEKLISSVRRSLSSLQIPPNPEPYKEGADPNIRSWVEWYGKVAGGIVARTGGRLQQLGQAAVLSGDPELKKLAGEKALIVARTWDPESGSSMARGDLQAASLLRGLVWCYDGAYDIMTREERKTLADCIRARGDQFWRSTFPFRSNESQNHPWDRAEAAAFAAVGLAEEAGMAMRFDYVAKLYAYRIFPSLGFKGENNEGLKYWSYGLGLAIRFTDVARYAVGLSFYSHPWLKQTARFPLYGMPARGMILSFGDNGRPNHAGEGPLNRPFTGKLAAEAGDAAALWYAGYPERNGVTAEPPVHIPQSMAYEHLGLGIFNTFLADGRENVALGFHSGKYFAGHQHPDNNSFMINAYGDKLAIDGGYYDWYGSRHFHAYSFTTAAHNTILVNGKGQKPRVTGGDGRMTSYFDSPNFGFVSGDASNPKLYQRELTKFDRDVLFLKPDFVAVYDRLAAEKPARFQWLLHSHSAKPIDYKAGLFRFERPRAKMSGVMLLPEKFTGKVGPSYTVGPVLGYSETPDPAPQPEWTLTVENADPAKETEFFSLMQIARAGESCDGSWEKFVTATGAAAVSKQAAVIFRRQSSGVAQAGPFKTDARAAAVILNPDGTVYDAMLKDGTYLEYKGKVILKGKGDLALKTGKDVSRRKVTLKFCGQNIPAEYRVQKLAFGREIHYLYGMVEPGMDDQSVKIVNGTGSAPVSVILMQDQRFLCGETGSANAYFLASGKLAFSFASAKPFTIPEFVSMGQMKIESGRLQKAGWQPPANAVKFEAEELVWESEPKALLSERPSASGGKASCSWDKEGKRGKWKFTIPSDGNYQLAICYATTYVKVGREILIDGKHLTPRAVGMDLRNTGGFGYAPAEWRWMIFPDKLFLKAGAHTLDMANMYGSANLDAFALIPVK